MAILDESDCAQLNAEVAVVKKGDLYKALHYVGDDPVKAEIEDILEERLSPDHFKLVLAVLNLSTGWKED